LLKRLFTELGYPSSMPMLCPLAPAMKMSPKDQWVAKRARRKYYREASRANSCSPVAEPCIIPDARLINPTLTGGAEQDPLLSLEDEDVMNWWRGRARFNVDD
jgi:hypothetical protein